MKEEQRIAREWPPVKTNGSASGTTRTGSSSSPPTAAATLRGTSIATALVPSASDDGAPSERVPASFAHKSESPATPGTIPSTVEGKESIIVHDAPAPAPAPTVTQPIKPRVSAPSTSRPYTAPPKSAKTPASPSKSTSSPGARPPTVTATATRSARSKTPTPRTPSKGTGIRSAPSTFPRSITTNITAKSPTPAAAPGSRPKTPSSKHAAVASRPSLPSSGLFAPTAASLAKSRNAPPPPVPPSVPRKVDLSRLSKPTAASAGKVRAVASVVSPPRPSPVRGTTTKRATNGPSRGAAAAAARGGAHIRPKAPAPAPADADAGAVGAEAGDTGANGGIEAADITGAVETEQLPQDLEDCHDESAEHVGHVGQAYEERDTQDSPPEVPTADSDADPVQSRNLTGEEHQDTGEAVPSEQLAPPGEEDVDHTFSEPEPEPALEHEPNSASSGMEPEARLDEVKLRHPTVGNELEDMVNMLQGDSYFPSSTHLEVAGEIPDED